MAHKSLFATLQVANYGIGGVYNHHTDASGEFSERRTEPESHGDRVATFMGYLSDVTAGGATVFPSVGITSFPKRGSAIFWYNIDRNGNLDRDTFHGGCPVLKGSKWITNKWIR
jgi:prolyl 4-hydroxylase